MSVSTSALHLTEICTQNFIWGQDPEVIEHVRDMRQRCCQPLRTGIGIKIRVKLDFELKLNEGLSQSYTYL